MKKIFIIIMFFAAKISAQQTNQPVNGWNCYVHTPTTYNAYPTKKFPTIIFFPGLGEVGSNAAAVIANGPGAYLGMGWNGSVTVGSKTTEFIILSLQPPTAYPDEVTMKQRIDTLISRYRIDTNNIFLTGLSHGGWCATSFVSDPINNFAKKIRAVVGVQSVLPAWDNAPWPQSYDTMAANRRTLLFEQTQDYRTADVLINHINTVRPGFGIFVQTNFGGGGHCCWEQFYGGSGQQPQRFTLDGNSENIYEWMAKHVKAATLNNGPRNLIISSNRIKKITVRQIFLY